MSVKELQKYTYFSKYARYNKESKRRETWEEAVERMKQMHLRRYPQVADEINWAFEYVKEQKVLGSQRALQYGGEPIERHNARIYNCTASYCDRLRFFQECFYLLLCGSGTGFSVQKHHIAKLPPFSQFRTSGSYKSEHAPSRTYVIPDTIEGWSDALGVLLSSYFDDSVFEEYANCNVKFDYSLIRKKGSILSSGAGKAPGAEPLRNSLEKIREVLDRCLNNGYEKLRPIDSYDIVMHASEAVLSGGVRRSATICVFSEDDEEMLAAKTGNWFNENPQRARSNNSVLILRGKITRKRFLQIIESVKQFGEPGFILTDSLESIFNPCVEINLRPIDELTKLTGWQGCNLSTINGKLIKTREDFYLAATAAAIIGTIQAGYTKFPYLGPVSERIFEREALLGVSITGMMDSPEILFNKEYQKAAAELVSFTNKQIAAKIGINPAARTTCIKPEGTTSCLLGCASGIHMHHARRYMRQVQANKMETPFLAFSAINPHACEDSVWSANKTDAVISFCCEVPDSAKIKSDLSAIDFLEHVKLTQNNWVYYGKNENLCTQPWLSHNVSNTINVRAHEWDDVGNYIFNNQESFTAVSLLGMTGDKDYPQAPFQAVYDQEEIERQYGAIPVQKATELIQSGIEAFGSLWVACDTVMNDNLLRNVLDKADGRADWAIAVRFLAEAYFNNNRQMATYCLKDVYNLERFEKLKANYREVDYTAVSEFEDNTKPSEQSACAGGLCSFSLDI